MIYLKDPSEALLYRVIVCQINGQPIQYCSRFYMSNIMIFLSQLQNFKKPTNYMRQSFFLYEQNIYQYHPVSFFTDKKSVFAPLSNWQSVSGYHK